MDNETPDMPSVWVTVDRELRRMHSSWSKLAREIEVSDQVIWNWKQREVIPANRHAAVAAFLGWSVEQLLGLAPEPQRRPPPPVTPEPVYTKRANDIARMFDELKDNTVRQTMYSTISNILQMAKAGQRVAEPAPPPEEPAPSPKPTSHPRAPAPKKKLRRHQ